MVKEIYYVANDGTRFKNEKECMEHEVLILNQEQNMFQEEIIRLDNEIWNYFRPNDTEVISEEAIKNNYMLWLKGDIVAILAYDPFIETEEERNKVLTKIREIIDKSDLKDKVYRNLCFDNILKEVEIRTDYESALRKVKRGTELSHLLGYGLGRVDLYLLAELHKKNKFRKKIEDLLTDCNFHSECSDFSSGKYEEYLDKTRYFNEVLRPTAMKSDMDERDFFNYLEKIGYTIEDFKNAGCEDWAKQYMD